MDHTNLQKSWSNLVQIGIPVEKNQYYILYNREQTMEGLINTISASDRVKYNFNGHTWARPRGRFFRNYFSIKGV